MLENNDELMSIVVLEAGAAWPAWLTEYQRIAPNAVVIAQASAESGHVFRARVVHRIEEATNRDSACVRVGVLVSNGATDEAQRGMREGVARAILKAIGSQRDAELVLAGEGAEADPARHELFGLAGALCEELGGTNVGVRVRFTGKSGVMRSLTPETDAPQATKGG